MFISNLHGFISNPVGASPIKGYFHKFRGDFTKISVLVRDVKIITKKYDMARWTLVNDLSSEAVFDVTAISVKYKYPLFLRLIGTPFTLLPDLAMAFRISDALYCSF
ncbi:hypothetical protein DENIS_3393 [Desulfonema ishimotonii]|uniref:Uncharacterized protein n=1 Tax=Desulfonema ishimotonii TaxID=45657 RepID=A0A401FZL7_9BACT|nr:hypothetical protein [Desulfonema ishimotonii]GBC62421.1 hypothetical protein DENIS_3393 [Desulfonema ishimotonii]